MLPGESDEILFEYLTKHIHKKFGKMRKTDFDFPRNYVAVILSINIL